jgi:hypothetical protein
MSKFTAIVRLVSAAIVSTAISAAPLTSAIAHEGEEHGMTCDEAGMNEMDTDIQAMPDGEAKTNAMKEMQMAGEMMAKKDMHACMDHMNKAMEMMEK